MRVLSIEQDEEYQALMKKMDGFVDGTQRRTKGKEKELEQMLDKSEYSLLKAFSNGKFHKEEFLKSKLGKL